MLHTENLVTDTVVFTFKAKFFPVIHESIQIKATESHLQPPRGNQLHMALYLPSVLIHSQKHHGLIS